MTPTPDILLVTVQGRPVYQCCECHRFLYGSVVTREAGPSWEDMCRALRPKPHDMPVGWASYAGGLYRCPEHKK